MSLIWNLVSLVKNTKHAVNSVQAVRGQAAHCHTVLKQFQNTQVQREYDRRSQAIPKRSSTWASAFFKGWVCPRIQRKRPPGFNLPPTKATPAPKAIWP